MRALICAEPAAVPAVTVTTLSVGDRVTALLEVLQTTAAPTTGMPDASSTRAVIVPD